MWGDDHLETLLEFLRGQDMHHEDARSVLGVALLACGIDPLSEPLDALDAASVPLDSPLLSQILEATTVERVARILWTPVGLRLSNEQFESLFRRVLADDTDDDCLYEAVGGAVDFLRRRPHAFAIPQEPLEHLIKSENVQSRIVALKGMYYSDVARVDYCQWILSYLQSPYEEERLTGLYCLGELLETMHSADLELLDADLIRQLDASLESWSTDADPDLRKAAETHLSKLRGLSDDSGSTPGS